MTLLIARDYIGWFCLYQNLLPKSQHKPQTSRPKQNRPRPHLQHMFIMIFMCLNVSNYVKKKPQIVWQWKSWPQGRSSTFQDHGWYSSHRITNVNKPNGHVVGCKIIVFSRQRVSLDACNVVVRVLFLYSCDKRFYYVMCCVERKQIKQNHLSHKIRSDVHRKNGKIRCDDATWSGAMS